MAPKNVFLPPDWKEENVFRSLRGNLLKKGNHEAEATMFWNFKKVIPFMLGLSTFPDRVTPENR